MEKYLTKIKEFDARVAITRLRIIAHPANRGDVAATTLIGQSAT